MQVDLRFWGVVVKPGEVLKCDPGEVYYHVSQIALGAGKEKENVEVFVNIDDKRIKLATLSADNGHSVTGLVFNKKFELLHSSMTSSVSFTGYQFKIMDRYSASAKGGDESYEEVPLLIPLDSNTDGYKNNEHGANKLTAPRPADAPSSIPKATAEEPTSPEKPKGDDKDKTDAQNPSDGDESESSEDVDYPRKKTKGKDKPVETPLKIPQGKKAKIATPTTGNKTGYVHVATPYPSKQDPKTSDHVHVATTHPKQARKASEHVHVATTHPKQAPKTSDHVHVATPHPKQARKASEHVHVATPYPASKRARKTPENNDKSTQSTGHFCGPCNRTFSSLAGLRDHSKAKHGAPK